MTPDDKAKAGFVGVKRRRGRRDAMTDTRSRALPPLPKNLRPEIDAARARHAERPASPGVAVYPDGEDGWFLDAPHRDLDAWEIQICEAFGTRSHSVMWTFLHQLAGLCEQRAVKKGDDIRWMPDAIELNFMLALIHSERPDTPLQAALLAQMCATNLLMARLTAAAVGREGYVDPLRAGLAAKMANAFANQSDAYLKLRGKVPKQEITVKHERHVHLHYHKHAHLHRGGGAGEISDQGHGPSEHTVVGSPHLEHERSPALPRPDPTGVVVPLPCREGEGQMSPPRRGARIGSAKG